MSWEILFFIAKFSEEEVKIEFDKRNATFTFGPFFISCRLVEGTYPAYKSVIPKNNTNILTIQRTDLLNACKRVAVCSNQATSQIVFNIKTNEVEISEHDMDFTMSAQESLNCE